ncbi:hypothetical protein [Aeromonas sp. HMWF015]|uniref:hypothetical protein n=1 Tax=Aeromonas sp. HMWF015 TaxID=2056851 RepID=UPI002159FA9A|nr:hypothetical protein [Aeromonas sp. HMWF015]
MMGGLQRIKPVQLAPEDKNTGIRLIGIEGGIRFCTAQKAACPTIKLRIENSLQ